MLTIIKPRGDIKSNWESANPTLRMREWGIEWETTVGVGEVKIKIGDGTTPWLNLDYVIVNDITKKIVRTFAEVTAENPELTEGSAIDVLWAVTKKKFEFLNQKVTDISENGDIDLTEVALPTFTDYATDDSAMPDARTAISNITSSIKVPAFISNAKAALRGLVTLGEMRSLLVNSGMTTEAGKYFLDAAYGKTLADQISQLNSQSQRLQFIKSIHFPHTTEDEILSYVESVLSNNGIDLIYITLQGSVSGIPGFVGYSCGFITHVNDTIVITLFNYNRTNIIMNSKSRDSSAWFGWKKITGT